MILTGKEITKQVADGGITISPFLPEMINPNSYDYRLGPKLLAPAFNEGCLSGFKEIILPHDGYVIEPHTMYLGHTYETLGSRDYAMSLIGRSSLGRLGLFLQVDADMGHTGSCHSWTLEIVAVKPFKLYPLMRIGQISFWANLGKVNAYTGGYSCHSDPHVSKMMPSKNKADTNHL